MVASLSSGWPGLIYGIATTPTADVQNNRRRRGKEALEALLVEGGRPTASARSYAAKPGGGREIMARRAAVPDERRAVMGEF